jgi:hypothetical protein
MATAANAVVYKVARIRESDVSTERKISQLTILALRLFPGSPNQRYVQFTRDMLRMKNET